MTRLAIGVAIGAAFGVAFVAACAENAPASEPSVAASVSADELARRDFDAGPPRCPYGALEDPHRGFVRCLTPDERDAGWLPPPPQAPPGPSASPIAAPSTAPSALPIASSDADAGAPPAAERVGPAPAVEFGSPAFENGQVARVEKALAKASDGIAKCVAEHGGLQGSTGSLKLQFLVRARGRAEGVEVLSAKGVTQEAKDCVRLLIKNRAIGAPTSDPVGVTVTVTLKPK